MLTLHGTVANVLLTPEGVNRETGESYGGRHQVQLEVEKELKNGQTRKDFVNLNVDDPAPFKQLEGQKVRVPVGAFATGGQIRFFHQKGGDNQPRAIAAKGDR